MLCRCKQSPISIFYHLNCVLLISFYITAHLVSTAIPPHISSHSYMALRKHLCLNVRPLYTINTVYYLYEFYLESIHNLYCAL